MIIIVDNGSEQELLCSKQFKLVASKGTITLLAGDCVTYINSNNIKIRVFSEHKKITSNLECEVNGVKYEKSIIMNPGEISTNKYVSANIPKNSVIKYNIELDGKLLSLESYSIKYSE